ncbi:MFS transporter [Methylosinus trichosporium]|uniref:MFS transporter n=1 Tax=Methylosinus trichosporium (strain ATCC 35070 / NCIMB 11131 / UNIQEM 75 / OB3b) TaxID=595536 RepID=A0A2D2D058_METT3|nr:MFS transporter [Methylosinus trichosporium]ATQ68356.1 MFS transporter [Methylosinus trichosporium OB3b]
MRAQLGDTARRLRAILVGSLGNLVEWYDFYVYSAFSLYFAPSFFPGDDPLAQMLSAAGVFALGFLMRPIGGALFGEIGDRYGRRRALTLSVLLMCLGSLIVAVTPTHATIGEAAPAILLFARLLQGLSLGGEYGSSATYLAEMAEPDRRGFYSSFQYVTLIGGQLLALLVLLALQSLVFSPQELRAYGWRIPFAIGAALALFAFVMRRDLDETRAFAAVKSRTRSALVELAAYPREALTVVGLTMGGTLAFYVYTTYVQKFLKLSAGLTDAQTTWVSAGSLVFAMCLQPAYGALSDRIGRRPLLLGFGVLGTLFTVPLMSALHDARDPFAAFALVCAGWLIVGAYTSINAVVKAELFPAAVRVTGVSVPYALAVSVFGGTAEYVALWFKNAGHESGFYWYATAVIFCSLLVYASMTDTKKMSRIDDA